MCKVKVFFPGTQATLHARQRKTPSRRARSFNLTFWGAFAASELILFYYEKVNTKLKTFEALFIVRFFDYKKCNRFNKKFDFNFC